jgi:hypothetical protein
VASGNCIPALALMPFSQPPLRPRFRSSQKRTFKRSSFWAATQTGNTQTLTSSHRWSSSSVKLPQLLTGLPAHLEGPKQTVCSAPLTWEAKQGLGLKTIFLTRLVNWQRTTRLAWQKYTPWPDNDAITAKVRFGAVATQHLTHKVKGCSGPMELVIDDVG